MRAETAHEAGHSSATRRRRRRVGGRRGGTPAALVLVVLALGGGLGAAAPLQAIPVEPLMLRVQDAVGAPGERTAIVVRTYASRPIRRGKVASGVAPGGRPLGAGSAGLGTSQPIASCDSVVIFSVAGDAVTQPCDFDAPSQTFEVDFESLSATINAQDGAFAAIYVTLASDVVPGDEYTLALDLGLSYLDDPEDDPVLLETRSGTLRIRAANAAVGFSVDGGKVHPGSGAVIELGTEEPFEIQEGRLLITYDPAIARTLPELIADPRHGDLSLLEVTYPQPGQVQIDFQSALENWNSVPGDLLVLHFGTVPTIPIGTISPLGILVGPMQSALVAPNSIPLQVAWEAQAIEFETDHGIFNDGFDGGDSGFWSYIP